MNCIIALLYGLLIFLAALLYTLAVYPQALGSVAYFMPLIVSGAACGILVLGWLVEVIRRAVKAISL